MNNDNKTPEEMAEEYRKDRLIQANRDYQDGFDHGYCAGYKAAKAIVEEELQAVQAHRAEYPGLGAAQYALKSVLAKMGGK
jgi:hypothetical protein